MLVGYGVKPGATTRRPRKAAGRARASRCPRRAGRLQRGAGQHAAPLAAVPSRRPPPRRHISRGRRHPRLAGPPGGLRQQRRAVLAKPPVRKLAKDLGIDLSRLSGTGPGGSITRDDVQSARARPGHGRAR